MALECEERDRHAIENRIRDAQLPRMKALEEFDFAQSLQIPAARIRELAEGGYIERSEPAVLIGDDREIAALIRAPEGSPRPELVGGEDVRPSHG